MEREGSSARNGVPLDVLVVDDEPTSREALTMCVEALGHHAEALSDATAATHANDTGLYDLALVDLRLGADSGLDLVTRLIAQSPWLKVAVITAHGSVETAVEAIRRGAIDYIEKPVTPPKLEAVARQISAVRDLERGIETLRDDLERSVPTPRIVTRTRRMKEVYETARRVAASDATLLIRGESGTGKGVLARAVHRWSPGRSAPSRS